MPILLGIKKNTFEVNLCALDKNGEDFQKAFFNYIN